jgi:hypothetical protein
MALVKLGLWIECVEVGRPSLKHQKNAPLGACRMMNCLVGPVGRTAIFLGLQ